MQTRSSADAVFAFWGMVQLALMAGMFIAMVFHGFDAMAGWLKAVLVIAYVGASITGCIHKTWKPLAVVGGLVGCAAFPAWWLISFSPPISNADPDRTTAPQSTESPARHARTPFTAAGERIRGALLGQ